MADIPDFLKPFYDRASEAEEKLAKLEAALKSKTGNNAFPGQKEVVDSLLELQEKLEKAREERDIEREKARKDEERWAAENAKLQYRILHLTRALKEADEVIAKAQPSTGSTCA